MKSSGFEVRRAALLLWGLGSAVFAHAAGSTVYRCPGPPVLYTDAISPQEAKDKGCRTIEGAPITIMQSPPRSARPSSAALASARVDASEQRSRDADARHILEDELRGAEGKLADLQKQYNNGQPERIGGENNYAKYQARVAELKASVARGEADVAAIKRELAKLPQ